MYYATIHHEADGTFAVAVRNSNGTTAVSEMTFTANATGVDHPTVTAAAERKLSDITSNCFPGGFARTGSWKLRQRHTATATITPKR